MNRLFLKKNLIVSVVLATVGYAGFALAHDAGATLDPAGNNASATDLAQVFCYDDTPDSSQPPDHLYIQIEDLSPPVPGLLLSAQIYKDGNMTNITDTVSGDGLASAPLVLNGGSALGGFKIYYISVSKTKAGARAFNITYHCQSANNTHIGTDISVYQVQ